MSDKKGKAKRPGLIAVFFFFVILLPAIIWFQFIREEYTNKMLSEVSDQLLEHDLSWAGRGRDYAQYTVTCLGKEKSCHLAYRIPATTNRVPALVIVHTIDSVTTVFEMMNKAQDASSCVMAAINIAEYCERGSEGKLRTKNKVLGRGLMDGMDAVDLAIEFVRGHNLVDTNAVYLVGIGEAGVLAIPAAANYAKSLKGVVCIDADAMLSLKEWDEDDFASPIGWAKKLPPMKKLLVSTGGTTDAVFLSAFANAEQIQASSQNVQEKYSVALGSAIDWVWKDRPRSEEQDIEMEAPKPENSVVIKK